MSAEVNDASNGDAGARYDAKASSKVIYCWYCYEGISNF